MKNILKTLERRKFTLHHSDQQISLSSNDGWILTIYNRYSFISHEGNNSLPEDGQQITIASITNINKDISIKFEDNSNLIIDFSPDGYIGPEAMQLTGPNNQIIIWN